MKVMVVCSTSFYDKVEDVKIKLESNGHKIVLPNCYGEADANNKILKEEEYQAFFAEMFSQSREKIKDIDAILVLNYTKEKNGIQLANYIGASTFLEMYEAFMNSKKIYMMNGYPDNMLLDEIKGFSPIIINGDLDLVK